MTTLTEFMLNNEPSGFSGSSFLYNKDGDFLALYLQDEASYAERLDDLVTVYYSESTSKMVGCKIKGVQRLLDKMGCLGVIIDDQGISVAVMLAIVSMESEFNQENCHHYKELQKLTEDVKIPPRNLVGT